MSCIVIFILILLFSWKGQNFELKKKTILVENSPQTHHSNEFMISFFLHILKIAQGLDEKVSLGFIQSDLTFLFSDWPDFNVSQIFFFLLTWTLQFVTIKSNKSGGSLKKENGSLWKKNLRSQLKSWVSLNRYQVIFILSGR